MEKYLVAVILMLAGKTVHGLECYECSSILDSGCGAEWTVSADEAANYKVQCPNTSKACDKIVSDIQGSGVQHVYRKCWSQTSVENWAPSTCTDEDVRGGVVCHCTGNACNGQQKLEAAIFKFISMVTTGNLILKIVLQHVA